MVNRCINCCKWITCKEANLETKGCKDFKYKRTEVIRKDNKNEYEKILEELGEESRKLNKISVLFRKISISIAILTTIAVITNLFLN